MNLFPHGRTVANNEADAVWCAATPGISEQALSGNETYLGKLHLSFLCLHKSARGQYHV